MNDAKDCWDSCSFVWLEFRNGSENSSTHALGFNVFRNWNIFLIFSTKFASIFLLRFLWNFGRYFPSPSRIESDDLIIQIDSLIRMMRERGRSGRRRTLVKSSSIIARCFRPSISQVEPSRQLLAVKEKKKVHYRCKESFRCGPFFTEREQHQKGKAEWHNKREMWIMCDDVSWTVKMRECTQHTHFDLS